MSSLSDVNALSSEMIHKYCLLVKNHAMKGYSAVTKEIISYIDFHYTEDLNLNYFAGMFNMSKTYLSNLFKKETGVTLTDFIHQVRMRPAHFLYIPEQHPQFFISEHKRSAPFFQGQIFFSICSFVSSMHFARCRILSSSILLTGAEILKAYLTLPM